VVLWLVCISSVVFVGAVDVFVVGIFVGVIGILLLLVEGSGRFAEVELAVEVVVEVELLLLLALGFREGECVAVMETFLIEFITVDVVVADAMVHGVVVAVVVVRLIAVVGVNAWLLLGGLVDGVETVLGVDADVFGDLCEDADIALGVSKQIDFFVLVYRNRLEQRFLSPSHRLLCRWSD